MRIVLPTLFAAFALSFAAPASAGPADGDAAARGGAVQIATVCVFPAINRCLWRPDPAPPERDHRDKPEVRDHRDEPEARDHRSNDQGGGNPDIRDHRADNTRHDSGQQVDRCRDHRTDDSRDHRGIDVRDHRTGGVRDHRC